MLCQSMALACEAPEDEGREADIAACLARAREPRLSRSGSE